MANFLTRIFGSRNQRLLRQYSKIVSRINALEEGLQALDDAALRAKTDEFRKRYGDGESLDDLLPDGRFWCSNRCDGRALADVQSAAPLLTVCLPTRWQLE